MLIEDEIAKYIEVLNLSNENYSFDKEKWIYDVDNKDTLEDIATNVRKRLGISDNCPLDNLIDKLEDNNFLILKVNYEEDFDGFCEYVDNLAFIILSSKGYERNRFTLAHELGHLILNFKMDLTEKEKEEYCNLFASSLLLPKKAISREIEFNGKINNRNISINEINLIAYEYKVSLNAVIMRLYNLNYITESKKRSLFITLNTLGLSKEQIKVIDEEPKREKKLIYMLESENIITTEEMINYLGVTTNEFYGANISNRC